MTKRILVTGGAGFVGSHLIDRLLAAGHEVTSVDNYYTGRTANLTQHKDQARFREIRHDVVEPIDLEVDQIYHLACPASPVHYQADPIKTMETSVLGTRHLLQLAQRRSARLLLASTSEIYGDPQVHPQPESYWGHVNTVGIRSCYDEGKRAAETMTMDYHRQKKTNVAIVRIFNTYGPRMLPDDGRVVSNFVVQALRGEALTVYGEGQQTRSFCFVADLVEGFIRMMASELCGPVNLGNPEEFTVKELAAKVLAMTQSRSTIVKKPLPADDPSRRRPDISVAKRDLGWQPSVPLEQGLQKTIAYFREQLSR